MSIEVAADELAEAITDRPVVYLLTLGDRPRPHVGAVGVTVEASLVRVRDVGKTARGDIAGHGEVTLLWAPPEPGGYSLIVDGTATVVGDEVHVEPQRAVLHRPAPSVKAADGACGSDCIEVPLAPPPHVGA